MAMERHQTQPEPPVKFIHPIALLAGPVSEGRIATVMDRSDFRKNIEKSTPAQIVRDLLIELGVVGPRPRSPQDIEHLDAYIAEQARELDAVREAGDEQELADLHQENSGIVRESSGIVRAFKRYREAEIDHWGISYDIRHYETRIHEAEDIGTFVVAQAWKQVNGIE